MSTYGDLGLFYHFGVYSVSAYDNIISARRRKIKNGSEWYMKRLKEKNTFRPTSGYKDTQKYHKETYGDIDYKELAKQFTCEKLDIDEWMKIAKKVNAKYVILTARHHDGYTLWNSKVSQNWNSVQTGPKIDIVQLFKISARKYGLMFGIYYSWIEFDIPFTIKYINNVVKVQIKELMEYEPDIWWFDGSWLIKTKYAIEAVNDIVMEIHNRNPNAKVNDRVGDPLCKDNTSYLGQSNFRVYEDRAIPKELPNVEWESCQTIGLSWGYNKFQEPKDYKSGRDLFEMYNKVKKLKGRLLLNLGPKSDGTFDEHELESLLDFSKLVELN